MVEVRVEGICQGYNKSGDKPAGICVNDTWYNGTPTTESFLKPELKGKLVTLTLEGGKIAFIQVLASPDVGKGEPKSAFKPPYNPEGARIGMAMNCANRKVISDVQGEDAEQWSVKVVAHGLALLAEMDKHETLKG